MEKIRATIHPPRTPPYRIIPLCPPPTTMVLRETLRKQDKIWNLKYRTVTVRICKTYLFNNINQVWLALVGPKHVWACVAKAWKSEFKLITAYYCMLAYRYLQMACLSFAQCSKQTAGSSWQVQREFQRRGIASLMLEGGIRLAQQHRGWEFNEISLTVALRNHKAIAFYETMGFQHSQRPKKARSAFSERSIMKKRIWCPDSKTWSTWIQFPVILESFYRPRTASSISESWGGV